jgi:AcrR family transcriptional regulator
MNRQTTSRREEILEAASQVVRAQGVAHLTLEGVAQEAGVSKGGLLYHFSNKEALITGMLDLYLERFEAQVAQTMAEIPEATRGRWLRAFVQVSFREGTEDPSLAASMLAAIVGNRDLLQRLRSHYLQWMERALAEGIPRETVLLVMQATDGLWYSDLLGMSLLNEEDRRQMLARLLQIIEER